MKENRTGPIHHTFLRRRSFLPHPLPTLLVASLLSVFLFFGFVDARWSGAPSQKREWVWIGTWRAAPQLVESQNMPPSPGLTPNTMRQVICVSIGGKILRVKFSNEYGKTALELKGVRIAGSKGGSKIDESTVKSLSFKGSAQVIIESGTTVTSDPISFDLEARMELAITISFGKTPPELTGHPGSRTTSYLLSGGVISMNSDFTDAVQTDHWYVINGVDVEAPKSAAAIAILGNSISDGRGAGTNKQDRWPDVLATRLMENRNTRQTSVLNMGIGGNCVVGGGIGPTALDRFDRDVLSQPGVRWLIITEGVNDLGLAPDSVAAFHVAKNLVDAYDNMIIEAHARGIKVYGATITPIQGSFYFADYRDNARNSVNKWIRTSGHFDAIIDFDKLMRDPTDTLSLLPGAQSGDYLHPNETGYQMMGQSISLSLFE